ncbi:DUF2029 domain-containing protein [Naumannella sp. ID2617S]|nr:DUF2029 domain-containing protein [Naumannella sp. ID2617S]
MEKVKRVALWVLYALPPLFAAVYAGATEVKEGQFVPWTPSMIDLEVYVRTAQRVLEGHAFYNVRGDWLPFIYPPFAALLAVPFALLDKIPGEVAWLLLNGLAVMAICHRLKFRGWQLSLVATAAIWMIEPLRMTLGFGQVNIFMMALVALDLMPGPRLLGKRRRLPEGWLTGIATAVKLTPALFAVYLFLSGRVKAAIVTFLSFVAATVIGFLVLPKDSVLFWTRLVGGDSGMNTQMKYYTNQSVIGNYIRFAEVRSDKIPLEGLALAGIVCVIGLVAAVLWHRNGHAALGICLTGFAGLLASPISWSHHFVWVMPLAIVLVIDKALPSALRFYGLVTSLWVAYAPFMQFVDFQDEFKYTDGQKLIDAGTMFFGIGLFVLALVLAIVERRRRGLPWLPLTLRRYEVADGTGSELATSAVGAGGSGSTAVGLPVSDTGDQHSRQD